ncbi:TIGR03757 family integrating conjugative element protein [Salmonella enterica]|uniref:TIGR03757 family integrating conjugative element protein n=1 Tax=Salmonella typhimurium (strain SL1344) TaxID=216597 RepID=A0A718RRX2_SALTS|nr:TIGR03757 family integrating conjugative element protein [Salmonella enterica]EBX7378341.1 TIGR03757 family integrating conjugative element protein [Salmonella enterica subsp. enterica serovar Takoradi]ECL7237745.1 TIGR03757 family integrating conjugative element protein [Salmonella enterica subsp. enterica serovar Poona]EDK8479907.1 TIGR03757 family integrating conjugative element protein [Salmonella enterica subsp. enterica serovar Chailey]EDU9586117.1 TIGR03757 family integrating conjugat
MFRYLSMLTLMLSASSFASIAVYTDRHHPPINVSPDTRVVYLDAADQQQQNMFGPLAKTPVLAERQALSVIHAADWSQQQVALVQAYQGLIQAWQLGLKKYPAVVFDGRDVVYGTADIALAQSYRQGRTFMEGQP